ncbi:MAG: hypothetical protein ACYC3S_04690 [Chloroflexota bacterium]
MGELPIPMELPLDTNGFLRRECPNCKRQFKWLPSQPQDQVVAELAAEVDAYHCPYCWQPAGQDAWWTAEQLEYARQTAMAEAMGPALRRFARGIRHINKQGGFVHLRTEVPSVSRPDALIEPDDMVRVDFPCHPEEPLKVDATWEGELACLACGIHYPAELVRELPGAVGEERNGE